MEIPNLEHNKMHEKSSVFAFFRLLFGSEKYDQIMENGSKHCIKCYILLVSAFIVLKKFGFKVRSESYRKSRGRLISRVCRPRADSPGTV